MSAEQTELQGYNCYICVAPCASGELVRVDQYFESVGIEEFTFLIDDLGLHHCDGPANLFHEGLANVCAKCFHKSLNAFLKPLFLPFLAMEKRLVDDT